MGHGGSYRPGLLTPSAPIYFLDLSILICKAMVLFICLIVFEDDKELYESRTGWVVGTQWSPDKRLSFLLLCPSLTGTSLAVGL